jgi:hypothetical protein
LSLQSSSFAPRREGDVLRRAEFLSHGRNAFSMAARTQALSPHRFPAQSAAQIREATP